MWQSWIEIEYYSVIRFLSGTATYECSLTFQQKLFKYHLLQNLYWLLLGLPHCFFSKVSCLSTLYSEGSYTLTFRMICRCLCKNSTKAAIHNDRAADSSVLCLQDRLYSKLKMRKRGAGTQVRPSTMMWPRHLNIIIDGHYPAKYGSLCSFASETVGKFTHEPSL